MKHLNLLLPILFMAVSMPMTATDIGGTVTTNVTLSLAGSPYVLTSDYTIPDGFTLTVEPGVEINFNNYDKDILVAGTLIAIGTALDSIRFTNGSIYGGGSLVLQASTNSHSLSYCRFENLGFFSLSAYDTGLRLEDTALSMDHCSFDNCGLSGVVHMKANASVLSNIGANNSVDIVELIPATLDRTCTWPNIDPDGFTYKMTDDQICPLAETLTIEAGVDIDMNNYYVDLQIQGELIAIGNISDSITFSSSHLNYGGGSVVLLDGSTAAFSYAGFSNLGFFALSDFDTGLYVEESDLIMDRCSFFNCGLNGVRSITADASAVSGLGGNNE